MNIHRWIEKSFVFSFLVLYYLYGLCWTAVIIFTIYLLNQIEFVNNTEEDKDKEAGERNTYTGIVTDKKRKNMFFAGRKELRSNNGVVDDKYTKKPKPTLQSLIYQTRSKENVVPCDRQPLVAVVKNNMHIHSPVNVDLDRRKPIYERYRSHSTTSIISPSARSNYLDRGSGSPVGLNNISSSRNRSLFNSSILSSPSNDSLEVHGSYFINRSVLHSPSLEKTNFSLVNDSFNSPSKTINASIIHNLLNGSSESPPTKLSTESIVKALKEKSKRKRAMPESTNDPQNKKKKIEDDDEEEDVVDSTISDLVPSGHSLRGIIPRARISKRKNMHEKEVVSTATQCVLDNEDTATSKKLRTEKEVTNSTYGLTQAQLNELSDETTSTSFEVDEKDKTCFCNGKEKTEDTKMDVQSEKIYQPLKDSISGESPMKKVSFVDTPDKSESPRTPDTKKLSNLKLSALKNVKSPYKKIFNSGSHKYLTPESIGKMRKYPVYFTAKIDIDAIQRHREEFGESGVSLKAFRLDKEEAAKRVNDLLDDDGSDVDFSRKLTADSSLPVTSSATSILPAIGFGLPTTLAISSLPSTLVSTAIPSISFGIAASNPVVATSTTVVSTSAFSFGNVTSVSTSMFSFTTASATASTVSSISAIATITPAAVQPIASLPSQAPSVTTTAFNGFGFGTSTIGNLPTAISLAPTNSFGTATLTPASSLSTVTTNALPPATSASGGFKFSFAASAGPVTTSVTQPFAQSTAPQQPAVSSTPSFSFGQKPITDAAISSAVSTNVPSTTQFSFSFGTKLPQSSGAVGPQITTTTSTAMALPQTIASVNPGFAFNPSTSQTSVAGVTKNLFGAASPAGFSFSSTAPNVSAPTAASTTASNTITTIPAAVPTQPSTGNIFGNLPPSGNIFGNSSAATTTTAQPPIFGGAVSLPSTGIFGQTVTTSTVATQPGNNIFGSQNTTAGFSFKPTAAPSTGFNFGVNASQNTASTAAASVFNAPVASTAQKNMFGAVATCSSQNMFGTPSTSAPTAPNIFGTPVAASKTSTQNIFGSPAPGAPSSQNIFGNNKPNAFGSTNTQNAFGSSSNAFGAAQPSMFGEPQKSSTGFAFGAPATTTSLPGGFSFGTTTTNSSVFGQSNNVFGSTSTNNPGVFGASNTQQPSAAAPFGSSTAKPAENPFGQQQATSGFDFSASLKQGPTINFGAAPQVDMAAKPTFNFGSAPGTPSFGAAPASPAFGQPSFGVAQAAPFGAPAGGGGFTIGAGTTNQTSNPARQTQRARRRLRR